MESATQADLCLLFAVTRTKHNASRKAGEGKCVVQRRGIAGEFEHQIKLSLRIGNRVIVALVVVNVRNFFIKIFAIIISICAGAGMVGEFALITYFLHIQLPFWQTVSAWTAGWLSLLAPLPGGLGALEASQVFALGLFGISATSAISVTLLMRGRDILIGGIGLLLAGRGAAK